MDSNFDIAFQLLGVGMITVFLILFLVVLLGNVIIWFVDRFFPEVEIIAAAPSARSSAVDANKMAAIVAAVQLVTNGKGRVVKVEKK
jgi:oxaloacetate decarboxylase gamma subunit